MIDIVKEKYMELARRMMIYYEIDGEHDLCSGNARSELAGQMRVLGSIIEEYARKAKKQLDQGNIQ